MDYTMSVAEAAEILEVEDDLLAFVYYYDTNMIYYTPWAEEVLQVLAASEDGKGKFYFFVEKVAYENNHGVGAKEDGPRSSVVFQQ